MKTILTTLLLAITLTGNSQNQLTGVRLTSKMTVFEISDLKPFGFTILILNEPTILDYAKKEIETDEFTIDNETEGTDYFNLIFNNVNYTKPFKVHIHCSQTKIITTFKVVPIRRLGSYDFKIENLTN
jgi:hypothetical protein